MSVYERFFAPRNPPPPFRLTPNKYPVNAGRIGMCLLVYVFGTPWPLGFTGRSRHQIQEYINRVYPSIIGKYTLKPDGTWYDVRLNRDDGTPGMWLGSVGGPKKRESECIEEARSRWPDMVGRMTLLKRERWST